MNAACVFINGDRVVPSILPALTLEAFGKYVFGAVIPSGAHRHWCFIASLQAKGLASVEVISTGAGSAGLVMLTAKGKRLLPKEAA